MNGTGVSLDLATLTQSPAGRVEAFARAYMESYGMAPCAALALALRQVPPVGVGVVRKLRRCYSVPAG